MNTSKTLVSLFAAVGLLGVSAAGAQLDTQQTPSRGRGNDSAYGRRYNPQTVETIHGQVVKVQNVTPMKGMGRGLHLLVKTDSGAMSVDLGPAWYLKHQDPQIQPKDKVAIMGSRVMFQGKPILIAAEVRKGDAALRLRDETGRPAWAGWRRNMVGQGTTEPGMMGRRMMGRGMMREGMRAERQQMMDDHNRMMSTWKTTESDLEHSIARMNKAQGDEKIQAMTDVINKLVEQRKLMFEHMASMQGRMMARMQPGMGMMNQDRSGKSR
jgi:hypothetical protein